MAEKKMMVVVGAKTSEFQKAMKGMQKSMKSVSKQMTSIGKGMTAAITLPIVALGGFAVKTGIEFESAFAGVRKTVNATEAELAVLSDGIRNMAKEIPAAATEIAGVAEAAGQLGIETGAILGFTRTMVDLGEATNMSATDAATALARLANITQMPQSEFDRLGSVVVALGNNLATTESEIVEMGLRLAGAGKQVGLSEAQILSFAGALSSVGIEAEAGGSAISKVFVNMQLATEKGGKGLADFAKVAGLSASEFKQAFEKDAAGAMIAFIKGLGDAESQGKSAIAMLDDMGISEVRMRDALLRAAGAGDLFNKSIATGTQAWEENTALTKEAEQRYETTAAQFEILKNKAKDFGIELYESLGPILKDTVIPLAEKLIEKISIMVDWFSNLTPETRKVIIVVAALAAAIGPLLIFVGTLISLFAGLIPIAAGLGIGVGALVGIIAGVVAGVGALIAIGVLLYKNWDKVKSIASSVWGAISDVIIRNVNAIVDSINKMIRLINKIPGVNIKEIGHLSGPSYSVPASTRASGGGFGGLSGLASGTPRVTTAGAFRVGERGEEIVHLPRGAAVTPNHALAGGGELSGTLTVRIEDSEGNLIGKIEKAVKDLLYWEGR